MLAQELADQVSISTIEALYRQRYRQFLGVALGMLGDRESAHDAVQETFARAIRSRAELHGDRTLASWLWRVLTNICLATRSSPGRSPPPVEGDPPAQDDGGFAAPSELRRVIASLPERQRLVLFLRHYADLDYNAIADLLEIQRGTVAATLHAAHSRLRDEVTFEEVIE
jgi:RNA polymerase sigma-70 factor (ECF subfamily)